MLPWRLRAGMDHEHPFVGTVSAALPRADVAGQALFSGGLAMLNVERRTLSSLLPPGLTPPDSDTGGRCLIAFGEHSEGVTFFGGMTVPWNLRYRELMIGIPFVHRAGSRGPHLFVRRMACDFRPAVWNGNVYYGFMKDFVRVAWDGEHFLAHDESHRPYFHAAVTPRSPGENEQQLVEIRAASALPVLGQRADGTLVHSRFEWDFSTASVEPATVRVLPGTQLARLLASQEVVATGHSCYVRQMPWRLSWPGVA